MLATVEEAYPELWHYTTANGLYGILTSQVLRATNIFYLNDDDEFKGFFDNKLFDLLWRDVNKGARHALISPKKRKIIESHGGVESFTEYVTRNLHLSIKNVTHEMDAFVASFCSPSGNNISDGLLSQWRGYGRDGGYAVVFDTQGLKQLLEGEMSRYLYSFSHWGDVDYFYKDSDRYEEVVEWESIVSESAEDLVFEGDEEKFQEKAMVLFEPILALATRHKHGGFSEEKEVRMTMIPVTEDEVLEKDLRESETKIKKGIQYRIRNGMLVPFINLFENTSTDADIDGLPITKIIIGPHPDREKRKKSIESMLKQLNINADVFISEIPYLGS